VRDPFTRFTETIEQMVFRRIFERLCIAETHAIDYVRLAEEDQPQLAPERYRYGASCPIGTR